VVERVDAEMSLGAAGKSACATKDGELKFAAAR